MMIFQDDILDIEGTEKEMGKKVNKDKEHNKATIIRLKNLSYAKKEVKKLCTTTKKKLLTINKNTNKLLSLIDYLQTRTN